MENPTHYKRAGSPFLLIQSKICQITQNNNKITSPMFENSNIQNDIIKELRNNYKQNDLGNKILDTNVLFTVDIVFSKDTQTKTFQMKMTDKGINLKSLNRFAKFKNWNLEIVANDEKCNDNSITPNTLTINNV